jgi:hypothetical protein
MSDTTNENGTPEQAADRVWNDFAPELVTDQEAERKRILEFDEMIRQLAQG